MAFFLRVSGGQAAGWELNISGKSDDIAMTQWFTGTLVHWRNKQSAHVPVAQWARVLVVREVTCFQIVSQRNNFS